MGAAVGFPNVRGTAYDTTNQTNSSTKDNSTITSNDFLTLLVAQMKNQDPTQPTDPSQYMNELVSVNSLQQLIDVNKQLSSLGGSTTGTSNSTTGV